MSLKRKNVTMPKSGNTSIRMAQTLMAKKNVAITKTLVAYANNTKWISLNRSTLRKKYGNEFVAIHNERVCLHGKDLNKLRKNISSKYPQERQSVLIDHISKRKVNFLL